MSAGKESGEMSQTKKKVRPLGAIRQSVSFNDPVPKFPVYRSNGSSSLDNSCVGIQGNAMSVPPVRETEKQEKKRTDSSDSKVHVLKRTFTPKSDSGSSTKENHVENMKSAKNLQDSKDLQDALEREKSLKERERSLKDEIDKLKKIIEKLKKQITEKDKNIGTLNEKLTNQEEEHKIEIDAEKEAHQKTQRLLQVAAQEIGDLKIQLDKQQKQHEDEIKELRSVLEARLNEVTAEKDKEIAIRDEKLARLKLQIADALKGNSWERQQQLEELTKELARMQEEAELLKLKLKSYTTSKSICANCPDLTAKLEKSTLSNREKEKTIKELNSLCTKFEKQLMQQEEIMKQFAESKGYKPSK